jgi:hypothetical protein
MASDAWDDSCIALKVSVDPSRKVLKMVCYNYSSFQSLMLGFTDQGTYISVSWNSQNLGCWPCSSALWLCRYIHDWKSNTFNNNRVEGEESCTRYKVKREILLQSTWYLFCDLPDWHKLNCTQEPHDVDMTDKNGMYRNSIIQYLLNSHWFGKEKSHRRSHDFDGQTMLPLVTLALILTAVRV